MAKVSIKCKKLADGTKFASIIFLGKGDFVKVTDWLLDSDPRFNGAKQLGIYNLRVFDDRKIITFHAKENVNIKSVSGTMLRAYVDRR